MLEEIFMKIIHMTKVASVVIVVIILARMLLKKVPKVFSYALWAVVLFRLLCPVSFEAPVCIVPDMPPVSLDYAPADEAISNADTGEAAYCSSGDALDGDLDIRHIQTTEPDAAGKTGGVTAGRRHVWFWFGQYVWAAGAAVMLLYGAVSYCKVRRKLAVVVPLRDNIYIADDIRTPFVIGFFCPKIYLPCGLGEKEQEYIICHEQHHIERLDHIVKALAFLALCVHWFNPLVWAAFILAGKDMEMSCDEAVIRKLGEGVRADYSASLLTLATGRRIIAGTPLAFGAGDTKGRIRNLANWKKPAFWVVLAAVIGCIALAVCLLANPKKQDASVDGQDGAAQKWFDYLKSPDEMKWDGRMEITLPAFPDTTFRWYPEKLEAVTDEIIPLFTGMPIWNVYFADLSGDGLPELCATVSYGSGMIDTHVIVYDYAARQEYTLWERGEYEYALRMENGDLICDKWVYPDGKMVVSGALVLTTADGGSGRTLELVNDTSDTVIMAPTTANISGAFADYVYVPLDGETYRYERIDMDTESVTAGGLLYEFTENEDAGSDIWKIYAVREYPDYSVVLVVAGADYKFLYQYSPSKRSDPDALQRAKDDGCVVMEDGDVTFGQEIWQDFVNAAEEGKNASVKVAHYYTLNPQSCSEQLYEAYKEDYPVLYILNLTYDGSSYTLRWNEGSTEYVRNYKYLMYYTGGAPSSSAIYDSYIRYVLTNDNTVTWEDIFRGMISSQFDAYIDHYPIYTDYR